MHIYHLSDSAESNKFVYLRSNASFHGNCAMHESAYEEEDDDGGRKYFLSKVGYKIDGQVSYVDSQTFYSIFSNDLDSYHVKRRFLDATSNSPLPISVRYMSNTTVVIERPPFRVPVRMRYGKSNFYSSRKSSRETYNAEIWIPWTVAILTNRHGFNGNIEGELGIEISLYFRNAPLTSFEDGFCPAYTPNVFSDGRICLGRTQDHLYQKINSKELDPKNISEIYSYLITEYFSGGWNMDVTNDGYFYFLKQFSDKNFVDFVFKRAQEIDNKYILNLYKKDNLYALCNERNDRTILWNIGGKKAMRLYMNYLSILTLDESLQFAENVYKDYVKSSSPTNKKRNTLYAVLSDRDPNFRRSNSIRLNYEDRYEYNELELNLKNHVHKVCMSSSKNHKALHNWKLEIKYNVEDFLKFASERVLKDYERYTWMFGDNRYTYSREDFYKKHISNTLSNTVLYKELFSRLIADYMIELSQEHESALSSAINKKVKEISNYFRTSESDATFKHVFELDLNEIELVLDKESLNKEVLA